MNNRKVIYLDDAIDLLEELETKRLQGDVGLLYAPMIKGLKALPSAQPERETGKWILSDNQRREDTENGNYLYICSNCLYSDVHSKAVEVPYCWHCGADMRGAERREE